MLQVHNRTRLPLFATHARLDCAACHRQPAPLPVRDDARRVRQLPPVDLPRDHQPEPRRRPASRGAARTATASPRRAGRARPSRTRPASRSPAGTPASPARAATGPASRTRSGRSCVSCHEPAVRGGGEPQPHRGRLPAHVPRLPHDRVVAAGEVRPLGDPLPADGLRTRATECASCHVGGGYTGTPTDCNSCHQRGLRAHHEPEPPGGSLLHPVPGLPQHRGLEAGQLRPLEDALRAHGRARANRLRALPRGRALHRHADGLQLLPPAGLRAHHEPEPPAGSFPITCQTCHGTNAWRPASVDHNRTRFPLDRARTRGSPARAATWAAATPARRPTATPATTRTTRAPRTRTTRRGASRSRARAATARARGGPRPRIDHSRTRFPLTGRAHARRLRALPRGRALHRHAHGLQLLPQLGLPGDDEPEPPGGRLPGHVRELPQHDRVAARDPRPQPHALPADGRAHARRLRALPRGRALHRHAHGLQLLPQRGLPGDHEPEPPGGGLPDQLRELPHARARGGRRPSTTTGRYFPIYSGKHRGKWSSCSDCHITPGNYKAFECILCHEHSNRTEVDSKHRGVSGYAYQSARLLPLPFARDGRLLGGPRAAVRADAADGPARAAL